MGRSRPRSSRHFSHTREQAPVRLPLEQGRSPPSNRKTVAGRASSAPDGGNRVGHPNQLVVAARAAQTAPAEPVGPGTHAAPLALVVDLCARLRAAGVSYCHWKSNDRLHLSASGENDLDLLVDRTSLQAFLVVLGELGFKQARPPRRRQVPGVLHYYGWDAPTGKLVHVDAQAQLVLGDDTTKNVHVPIEKAYLASCVAGPLF